MAQAFIQIILTQSDSRTEAGEDSQTNVLFIFQKPSDAIKYESLAKDQYNGQNSWLSQQMSVTGVIAVSMNSIKLILFATFVRNT